MATINYTSKVTGTFTKVSCTELGLREAANALSISTRTLWGKTDPRGPIPSVRIGTRVLYAVSDLKAAIERMKGGQGQ